MNGIAFRSTLQFVGGTAIGTALDTFMPTGGHGLQQGVEIIAQLIAGSGLSYMYFDWMTRTGYSANNDPTKALPFFMAFVVSQAKLASKMVQFKTYALKRLMNFNIAFEGFGTSQPGQNTMGSSDTTQGALGPANRPAASEGNDQSVSIDHTSSMVIDTPTTAVTDMVTIGSREEGLLY